MDNLDNRVSQKIKCMSKTVLGNGLNRPPVIVISEFSIKKFGEEGIFDKFDIISESLQI